MTWQWWFGLCVMMAGAGCGGWAVAAQVVTVRQSQRAFSERAVQIGRGEVVRFLNADQFLHQVSVSGPGFSYNSAEQEPGQVVEVRFPVRGVFNARCEIHPKMALTVTVE